MEKSQPLPCFPFSSRFGLGSASLYKQGSVTTFPLLMQVLACRDHLVPFRVRDNEKL